MIDPVTGWFEIKDIKTKRADIIANVIEKTWLSRYPRPEKVICNRGKEFMEEFKRMIKEDYGIVQKLITTRNPQANAILERVHQTIGNIFRTQQINKIDLDEEEPWSDILAAIAFLVRATMHTTLQHSPMQLVFGRDPFINISHEVDWRVLN